MLINILNFLSIVLLAFGLIGSFFFLLRRKTRYIGLKGSTTSCSVSPDSKGKLVKKQSLPSPLSAEKAKQLEKCIRTPVKSILKRDEKQMMPDTSNKFIKQGSLSSLSGSKKNRNNSSKLNIIRRKVMLETSRKWLKVDSKGWSRNAKQGTKLVRKRLDARSYTELFRKKAKVSDLLEKMETLSKGGGDVMKSNSSNEAEERAGDSCFSCSKRQRVNLDSKRHRCFCNAELSHEFHGNSLPKVVCERSSMSRSPSKDSTSLHDTRDGPLDAEDDNGREVEPQLGTELTEEHGIDMQKSLIENESDGEHAACVVCIKGGEILCCDGEECRRGYHLSCLDPPLSNVPPGVWHCIWCVRKKIAMGVHSVSRKLESIWDVRDAMSDDEVNQRQKQYLVKYQGLAHIHNRWLPETQLLIEAPELVTKFNRKNEVVRWKTDWTVPNRLLQKRLLIFPKNDDESCNGYDDNNSDCSNEWFVKWTGLDYDHATWELENASFLRSSAAMKLIRDYESRHKKAEQSSHLFKDDEERKVSSSELLSEFPIGGHDCYLSYVNKLREYWHKGQNAVVVDEKDRVVKVISFILSLLGGVCRPFLIISTSTAISLWEAEFSQLAPSANIVVYKGNRSIRGSIRTFEFYNERGCLMFEVLLSSPEVVAEDLEFLDSIAWEAIIVDECQRSKILRHLKQINILTAYIKLLVVSGQLKGSSAEYVNLLSFLDHGFDRSSSHHLEIDTNANISVLKKRLAQFIAYECKLSSSRFVEYWVPVQLSSLQLEQYCATLLSNSMLLRSCLKNDSAGDLDEVLVSLRKCCDHPYLVDQSLQSSVTKGLPASAYLDVDIKLSGKLQLLDKMLLEIKSRGLRVLIIFQSLGGSGCLSVGDILDDFVYQRFGSDSYIRVHGGAYVASRKQAALDKFNKESGSFVLLIENRACLRSIKLSSVDTVILFDSDWDPRNDIRALERITIESQFEQLKVFRLYTSGTVEEKNVILAKEGGTLDSNNWNLSRSTVQMLLTWGASYLFNKLDDFHGGHNLINDEAFLNESLCELWGQLPCNGENSNPFNCSKIVKAEQSDGVYPTNISLFGESHIVENNEPPMFFWTNLLEGRHPRWKLLSASSQRTRRKVQNFDDFPNEPEFKLDAVTKKRRNIVNTVDSVSLQPKFEDKRKLVAGDKEEELADTNITRVPEIDKSKEGRELHDAQRTTQLSFKPEISRLCQILQFSEGVRDTALRFHEFIMNDYNVGWDAPSTLQAFQISLCWTAASFLKHKIDHKKSFALAKSHLNYDCKETEARHIYFQLRKLKKVYARHKKDLKRLNRSHCDRTLIPTNSNQQGMEGEMQKSSQSFTSLNQLVTSADEQGLDFRKKNDTSCNIGHVLEICGKRLEKLLEKQQKEVQEFITMKEKGKSKLEEEHRLESALLRTRYSEMSVRLDKLNELDHNFKKKMDEQNCQMDICWKNLEASQLSSRIKEEQFKAKWMACLGDTKSGRQSVSLGDIHLAGKELFDNLATVRDDSTNAMSKYMSLPEDNTCEEVSQNVPSEVPEISVDEVRLCSSPQAAVTISIVDATIDNRTENTISEEATLNIELHSISEERNENCASILRSENPSPVTNVPIMQSEVQPSDVPETVLNKVVEGDDPKKITTSVMLPTTECEERDAMTSEIATIVEGRQEQDDISVTPTCGESHTSVYTRTGSSLVQLCAGPTQGSILPSHQRPPSTSPPSPVISRANMRTSMGAQQNQSNGIISSQQAQVPTQPVIEDTAEVFRTSITHPHAYLPQHLSTDMLVDGSIQCVSDSRPPRISESVNYHYQPTCSDPLRNEMERILKDKELAFKIHDETKSQLISECAKEMEGIRQKYDMLFQDAQTALVQKTKDLDACFNKVFVNKILAEALVHKNIKVAGSSAAQQAMAMSTNQFQLSFRHAAERRAHRLDQSSANTLMNGPIVAPPIQVVSHSSDLVSASPVGPHSTSMMRLGGDPSAGIGLRAPAPHLRPFRTFRPVSTSHLPLLPFGIPNQQP